MEGLLVETETITVDDVYEMPNVTYEFSRRLGTKNRAGRRASRRMNFYALSKRKGEGVARGPTHVQPFRRPRWEGPHEHY